LASGQFDLASVDPETVRQVEQIGQRISSQASIPARSTGQIGRNASTT
jgi:hypothetical protein